MKKVLIFVAVALLLITGCGKKEEEKRPKKIGNADGIVLKYRSIVGSVAGSPTSIITIYTDQRMVLEHTDKSVEEANTSKTITLTDQQYEEVINMAFSKEFLNLPEDLTTMETAGGSVEYITVYYDDTLFQVGGQYIKNSTFTKLEDLLLSYREK